MPPWLPGVLTAAALGLAGNYLTILLSVKLQGQAMAEHARRISLVETVKADHALVEAELRSIVNLHELNSTRIDGRLDASDRLITTTGHRIGAVEMKFNAIESVK